MEKYEFPEEDVARIREAHKRATKPTERRRVLWMPKGTIIEYAGLGSDMEITVPDDKTAFVSGLVCADYRDGQWHGWNGGECPVDPDDKVEVVFARPDVVNGAILDADLASRFHWYPTRYEIVAFRVVPRKPREYTDDDGVTWREVTE